VKEGRERGGEGRERWQLEAEIKLGGRGKMREGVGKVWGKWWMERGWKKGARWWGNE